MIRKKRITLFISLSLLLILMAGNFVSCEPEDWLLTVNCNDCYGAAPDSADLIVYLTINEENDSVPLTFYLGPIEDGIIDWQDTATSEEFYLYSKMDRNYTVQATYKSGSNTIEAFDADHMQLYEAVEECGSPCYIVKGGILDVRLIE